MAPFHWTPPYLMTSFHLNTGKEVEPPTAYLTLALNLKSLQFQLCVVAYLCREQYTGLKAVAWKYTFVDSFSNSHIHIYFFNLFSFILFVTALGLHCFACAFSSFGE